MQRGARRWQRRAGLSLAVVCLGVVALPRAARAWNPLRSLGSALVGSVIDGAVSPALDGAAGRVNRVIDHVDSVLDARIAGASGMLDAALAKTDDLLAKRVTQVDAAVAARLTQTSSILAARITQVEVGVDRVLGRAIGRIDRVLDQRVAQLGTTADKVIVNLDGAVTARIAQVDQMLSDRLGQLHVIVSESIADVDQVLEARIAQIDDVAGRRVGNIDVVATKQVLNIEESLIKVAGLLVLLAFIGYVLFEGYKDYVRDADDADDAAERTGRAAKLHNVGWGLARRLAAAAVGAGVIYLMYVNLPRSVERRALQLKHTHISAFANAERSLDFSLARYHASQLAILDPGRDALYRAVERKLHAVELVLTRPGLLRQREGVRQIEAAIAAAERAFEGLPKSLGGGRADPDLIVLKGFVSWQLATTRADELDAALLCASALELDAHAPDDAHRRPFVLRQVAQGYVRAYANRAAPLGPAPPDGAANLARLADGPAPTGGPLPHALQYNALVGQLDATASDAYVGMLDAHAAYLVARRSPSPGPEPSIDAVDARVATPQDRAIVDAKRLRRQRAGEVVAAFAAFDREVVTLDGTTAELAVFTINDAVLSQALYYLAEPDATDLAPTTDDPRVSPVMRARMAPIRIDWARRYIDSLGKHLARVIGYEEAARFRRYEQAAAAFQAAYVQLQVALLTPGADVNALRGPAARAAAALDLYTSSNGGAGARTPIGMVLLGDASSDADRDAVVAGYQPRRLRFL